MKRVGFRWIERGSCRHPEFGMIKGGSLCAIDFPALVGVIAHPQRGLFLFDTGYDRAFFEATETFPERFYRWTTPADIGAGEEWHSWLAAHDIPEDQLTGLIISHFHGDHVAGARNCAGLPMYCARAGLNALRSGSRFARVRKGLLSALVPQAMEGDAHYFEDAPEVALPSAFAPFERGRDILGDGSLLMVELPGHCAGHWGLAFVTEEDQAVLLAGDAVYTTRAITENIPPPRYVTAMLGHTTTYHATLTQLVTAQGNNSDLAILPSHCPMAASAFRGEDAD